MAKAPTRKPAADVGEIPRYRVNEKSFIGHALLEEGDETNYEGDEVGENLSPINEAAQAVVDAQAAPHPDKTDAPRARSTRRVADAASAGVGDAADEELG